MRTVQLVGDDGRVIHTFITDDLYPLEIYNGMLEGAQLVEGAGAQATPIAEVVRSWIKRKAEEEAAAAAAAEQAQAIVQQHTAPVRIETGVDADAAFGTGSQLAAVRGLAATMTAAPRVPAGHIDPRTTALGSTKSPLPHRGEGTTSEKPPEDLIIRPGRADGLGRTVVLEMGEGGQVVKAPAWRPLQVEGESAERLDGPRTAITTDSLPE